MKPWVAVRSAVRALNRHRLRAGLTTLGIMIGIAAVITMAEIGQGTSRSIRQTISALGANVIQIDPSAAVRAGVNTGSGASVTLTPSDCDAILRECGDVRCAAPSVDCHMQVIYQGRNWAPRNIQGTTPAYLQIRQWSLDEGQSFTDDDVRRAADVCLIGQTPARELFGAESPVGREVRANGVRLRVVGLLSAKGASMSGVTQDDYLLVPWTTCKFRLFGGRQSQAAAASVQQTASTAGRLFQSQAPQWYVPPSPAQSVDAPQMNSRFLDMDDIFVSADSPGAISGLMERIAEVLRGRHGIQEGSSDDFRIRNLAEIAGAFASTSATMTRLLLVLAVIALVVGGVGIMNIMLVSVTERTREIGLRMAVGARSRDILQQFLIEAVTLCLIGGLLGIAAGRVVSLAVSEMLGWPTEPSVVAVIAAVAVSAGVGLTFGFYPAWKAARLDPIAALRHE